MSKKIISEGRTSTEAIENGLKELKVSKDRVKIKVLEDEQKKSFFSILNPRVVKVEMTLIEKTEDEYKDKIAKTEENKRTILKKDEVEIAKKNLIDFLEEFKKKVKEIQYKINFDENYIFVSLQGKNAVDFIGYRGETLNALQIILLSIANKNIYGKVRLVLNISNYREKRQKTLELLANKISKTVVKTGKQVVLEPMSAYERKIVHNYLQNNREVKTFSVGEEPYRKVVIEKK